VDKTRDWSHIAAIAPDSRTVLLWDRHDPTVPFQAYVLPFDPQALVSTGPPRRIGGNVIAFNFSVDGRYLLYAPAGDASDLGLHVWENPLSTSPVPLEWKFSPSFNPGGQHITTPRFLADGRWIAFCAIDQKGADIALLVRPGEAEPHVVFEGAWQPFFTYDPKRLYLIARRTNGTAGDVLGFVELDSARGVATSGFKRVAFEPGRGSSQIATGGFTPDRRWFYFDWTEEEGDVYVANLIVR
jgi:hypothetical protein